MRFGLSEATIASIQKVFEGFPEIEKVVLYGSRATGTFKPGSDIDLTMHGGELQASRQGDIAEALEELLLPYRVDLSIYADLEHAKLKENIERVGVVFYERKHVGAHPGAVVKAGWQTKQLGDVCSFLNRGVSPVYLQEGGIRVLNQKCVRDHRVSFELSRRHDPAAKAVKPDRLVQHGDVLVNSTGTGTLGRVAQLRDQPSEPTTVDSHITIVRPKPGLFHLNFFGYMMIVIEEIIQEAGEGCGGQTELARSVLAERFSVTFPSSLPEQQRIVGILDEAFAGLATAKAHAEKNLQNARALFENHLRRAFHSDKVDWTIKPFEDCIETVKYGAKIQRKDFLEAGRFPIVSQESDFINGYWDDSKDVFKVSNPVIIFGDHTQVLKYVDFDFVLGADGVKVLAPKRFLDSNFFYYHLRGIPMKALGYARHYKLLKEQQIGYPDISIQIEIAGELKHFEEETQRLESLYQRKLAALDSLKQSLLHQAFSGQL